MYLCKFGQNPSTGSKDITSEKSYADADMDADADGIRTKNNMSPTIGCGDIMTKMVGCLTPISTIHFCPHVPWPGQKYSQKINGRTNGPVNAHLRSAAYTNNHV